MVESALALGCKVKTIAIALLALGNLTRSNSERILELERSGDAVLWRDRNGDVKGYFIVGVAFENKNGSSNAETGDGNVGVIEAVWEVLAFLSHCNPLSAESVAGLEERVSIPECTLYLCLLPPTTARQHG